MIYAKFMDCWHLRISPILHEWQGKLIIEQIWGKRTGMTSGAFCGTDKVTDRTMNRFQLVLQSVFFYSKCNVNCIIYQQVCALWRGFPGTVFTRAHYFIFCAIHSVQLSHFAGECKKTYRIIEAINFYFIRELAWHSSIDEIDINMSTQRKTYRSSPKSPSIITKSQSNYVMANVMDDNRH